MRGGVNVDRIKKTLYLDPQEEKALRDEAHELRMSESELLRHYLKMIFSTAPPGAYPGKQNKGGSYYAN